MNLNDIINYQKMYLREQIAELNERTIQIAHDHPTDYHEREDYQGYVNLRARLIAEKEKGANA